MVPLAWRAVTARRRAVLDPGRLTAAQRQVVMAPDRPLAVVAGPGSGKTSVLAARVAELVGRRGADPATVLALAFSTGAARELRARLVGVLGEPGRRVDVATLHAWVRFVPSKPVV